MLKPLTSPLLPIFCALAACAGAPAENIDDGVETEDAAPSDGDSGTEADDATSEEDSANSDVSDPTPPEDTSSNEDDSGFQLDTGTPSTEEPTRTLNGTVFFEDQLFDTSGFSGEINEAPARGVVVEARVEGELISQTLTDENGRFELQTLQEAESTEVTAFAVSAFDGNLAVVRDRSNERAVYALATTVSGDETAPDIALLAEAGGFGGAFNVADTMFVANRFVAKHTEARAPELTISWQRPLAFDCGSCFQGGTNTISLGGQLEDPDEYDDDIILHEYGHYFVLHYAHDDSPGGSHRDRRVSPTLAWGEGLAYFFTTLVNDNPNIVDNFLGDARWIDVENIHQQGEDQEDFYGAGANLRARMREEIVAGFLWDNYDDSPEESDTIDSWALGEDEMMRLFLGPLRDFPQGQDLNVRGMELADWLHILDCDGATGSSTAWLEEREYEVQDGIQDAECAQKQGIGVPLAPLRQLEHENIISLSSRLVEGRVLSVNMADGRRDETELVCTGLSCVVPHPQADEVVVVHGHDANGPFMRTIAGKSSAAAFLSRGVLQPHPRFQFARVARQ